MTKNIEAGVHSVLPLTRLPNCTMSVPGSKSITNRALILAALHARQTPCELLGALESEDTLVMIESLRLLGFQITADFETRPTRLQFEHNSSPRLIPSSHADLNVQNSGTSMRFLTAFLAAGQGTFTLDGIARMRERPIHDLLTTLNQLGANVVSTADTGCPPVRIVADGLAGGVAEVRADLSSQFLSAILMAAPMAHRQITLRTAGKTVSEPYIDMTLEMMKQWGWQIEQPEPGLFVIPTQPIAEPPKRYAIEPDASAASYFFAAAAITGGRVAVTWDCPTTMQGDLAFLDVLESMGCSVSRLEGAFEVQGPQPGQLRGIDVDMNAISDTVMTLAAVACFANSPTQIRNVEHIRWKETDRLTAICTELERAGVRVKQTASELEIFPGRVQGATFDTYNDHRMAMSLALLGLKVPGVKIRNPGCVAKTYPGFWQDWELLQSASA